MILVLNTSGLTLIHISVIVYRVQAGSLFPADIFIPILVDTLCSTLGGLLIVSIYQKVNIFKPTVLAYILGVIGLIAAITFAFNNMPSEQVREISTLVSNFILFSTITLFILMAVIKRVNAYEYFIEGAKEGFQIAINIIPFLVAMLVAIAVFRASGGLDLVIDGIRGFVSLFGVDTRFVDGLPTALMKPLSGSGARGMMVEGMTSFGADSFVGRLVCVLQGSTDTTLYVIAVYFGSVSIRNTRHAIICGLFADLVGIIAAILISYLFFG
jgi:spore maturation protein SpmB